MWVIGGEYHNPPNPTTLYSDVWSSSDGVSWAAVTTSTNFSGRAYAGAVTFVTFEGIPVTQMYLIGGETNYLPPQPTPYPPCPPGTPCITYPTATPVPTLIGYRNSSNDVWSSSDGLHWDPQTSAGSFEARDNFGAIVYDNKIWIMGGAGLPYPYNYSDVFNSGNGANWAGTANGLGINPSGFTAVAFNNYMNVIGGLNAPRAPGATPVLTNNVYTSADGVFWSSQPAAQARSGHTSVVANNKIWVIGGQDSSGLKNDVWYSALAPTSTPTKTPFKYGYPTPTFSPLLPPPPQRRPI